MHIKTNKLSKETSSKKNVTGNTTLIRANKRKQSAKNNREENR